MSPQLSRFFGELSSETIEFVKSVNSVRQYDLRARDFIFSTQISVPKMLELIKFTYYTTLKLRERDLIIKMKL